MTPDQLFSYVTSYSTRRIASGRTGCYPTVATVMRRFKVSTEAIETAIEDFTGSGYLGLVVATACRDGCAEIEVPNKRLIEAY